MRAYRRRLCHEIFDDVEDLDSLAMTIVTVLRGYRSTGVLPNGLTIAETACGRKAWAVFNDAPRKIGNWVSMDPAELGAPQTTLWIGFDAAEKQYAVVHASEHAEALGVEVTHAQSLEGICYKDDDLM